MKKRLHGSWVLALLCLGFVCGVALALAVRIDWWVGVGALPVVAVCIFIRQVRVMPIAVAASMCIGLGYGSAHLGVRDAYAPFVSSQVTLSGRVREDTSRSSSGGTSIQVDGVTIAGAKYPGTVLLSVRSGASTIKRGDIITVAGALKAGFGSFPAVVSVVSIKGVTRPVPGDIGRVVRDWFADAVRRVVPEPQASLGIGFLTGQKSALPEDLSNALKIAGLTHIVVASGYNLTILVQMARKLFLRLSKYVSAVFSGVMITAFMAITGLSPSMTRAGLVSGLGLMAWYYGHGFHPFVLLPFAAAVTVAIQPSYIWGDMGWQLSFSAFAGVMFVAPLLQVYFFGKRAPGVFRQILGETIAAHAVTMPIIALGFGTVSNVAIIANILVVPLVPLAMLLTFICGLLAIFSVPFAWLVSIPTTWLLGYMTTVATFVSELDWAQSEISSSGWLWAAYVAMLALACFWMWHTTKHRFAGADPMA